jgi:hypothetical protein
MGAVVVQHQVQMSLRVGLGHQLEEGEELVVAVPLEALDLGAEQDVTGAAQLGDDLALAVGPAGQVFSSAQRVCWIVWAAGSRRTLASGPGRGDTSGAAGAVPGCPATSSTAALASSGEVEGVGAHPGMWSTGAGDLGISAVQIHRRRLQLGGSGGAEGVEQALQGRAGLALPGPDDRAVVVMIGDHGQIAVALAVGNLVDPDAGQRSSRRASSMWAATTRTVMAATASQEQRSSRGDGRLVGALGR